MRPYKRRCAWCGLPSGRSAYCSPECLRLLVRYERTNQPGHFVEPPLPPEPTRHPPGSAGKLEVLAARLAAGLALWHPEDATESL